MPALPSNRVITALRLVRAAVPLGIAVVCLWALVHRLEEWNLPLLQTAAADIGPMNWLGAAGATAVAFWALGRYDAIAHRHFGTEVADVRARRAGMAAIAFSQALGFGLVTGSFARWRLLPELSPAMAAKITALVSISFMCGLGMLLAAVALISPALPVSRVAAVGILLLGAAGVIVAFAQPSLRLWHWTIRLPTIPAIGAILCWTTVDAIATSLALWLLVPSVDELSWVAFLPPFLVALMLGLLSGAPGGVGPFELALLALLPQVPAPNLIAGIVAFRLIYFAMPAIAAIIILVPRPARLRRKNYGPPTRAKGRAPFLPHSRRRAETVVILQNGGHVLRARRAALAVLNLPQTSVGLFAPLSGALPDILPRLLEQAHDRNRVPSLYKCDRRTALAARRAGWRVLRIAREAVLDPQRFDVTGRPHRQLRRKLRHAEQAEVTVMPCGDVLPEEAMAAVDLAWRLTHGPAAGTTMGRFEPGYLETQAVYTAWSGPNLVAFASFHQCEQEWCLDLMRSTPDMPDGTMHALIHAAVLDARDLGVPRLSLAAVPDFALLRGSAAGLAQFKKSFAPRWEPLYLAAPSWPALALAAADILRAVRWPAPVVPVPRKLQPEEQLEKNGFTLPRAS